MASEQRCGSSDVGLLVLRLVIGAIFVWHGVLKFQAGEQTLTWIGGAMGTFGITGWPMFWGVLAALSELLGGIALILGLCMRPLATVLTLTMIVATAFHVTHGADFNTVTVPIAFGAVLVSLVLMGPGRFSMGRLICGHRCCSSAPQSEQSEKQA